MTTYSSTNEFEGATFVKAVSVQSAWQTIVADTPPDLVDAHVEDEWSLAQTLRHLILATDAWLRGGILQEQHPFHEIGQIFTGASQMGFDMSVFSMDPPAYEEILAVRAERQQMVTDFLSTVTPELLAEERENPWGGDDRRPSVGDCIRVILEEEWAHVVRVAATQTTRLPHGAPGACPRQQLPEPEAKPASADPRARRLVFP